MRRSSRMSGHAASRTPNTSSSMNSTSSSVKTKKTRLCRVASRAGDAPAVSGAEDMKWRFSFPLKARNVFSSVSAKTSPRGGGITERARARRKRRGTRAQIRAPRAAAVVRPALSEGAYQGGKFVFETFGIERIAHLARAEVKKILTTEDSKDFTEATEG